MSPAALPNQIARGLLAVHIQINALVPLKLQRLAQFGPRRPIQRMLAAGCKRFSHLRLIIVENEAVIDGQYFFVGGTACANQRKEEQAESGLYLQVRHVILPPCLC